MQGDADKAVEYLIPFCNEVLSYQLVWEGGWTLDLNIERT